MNLTVQQRRGGLLETVHTVSARVVAGEVSRWAVGEDLASFWRSASKPLQLLSSLEALPADTVDTLRDADLAIGTASHSGQPFHVDQVRRVSALLGVDEAWLKCGGHWPMHEPSARALASFAPIHNNCSGKHTFMLGACRAQGWPLEYRPLDHPLQQRNLARVREWGGVDPGTAVDGCGVPTFHVPLSAQARTWARLAAEMTTTSLAGRIGNAMVARPELVSGDDRLDLLLTRAATEPLACKIGAEGLFCVALPRRGLGVAVKVHTGNTDVLAVAVRAVLDELAPGLVRPERWPWSLVNNVVGAPVGDRVAVWAA